MSAKKSHSREREDPPQLLKAQALISADPGQSLWKLASIV